MHNSLHKMNLSTYGDMHINLLCEMKIMKERSRLIIHKPRVKNSNRLKVLHSPPQWGHQNEDTKEGRREPAHSRAASGLVYARRPKWGVSLFVKSKKNNKGGTTLFYSYKEALSNTLESHT